MHHSYCSDDDQLLILSSSAAQALLGFSVPSDSDVCHEYDQLDLEQFKAVVNYMVKLYRDNASTLTPDPLHSLFYDSHPPAAVRIARLQAATR